MEIKEIKDINIWEQFASNYKPNTFLQSWGWGEYQKLSGNKIFRLGLFDNGQVIGVCLATKIKARKGPLLYCQHGPLMDWKEPRQFEVFLDELYNIGKNEGVWFIRVTPLMEDLPHNLTLIKSLAFNKAPVHNIDAQITLVLDLSFDEEILLQNMRKSTRYEIRKAKKAGVTVFRKQGKDALKQFYDLYVVMQKRQRFIPYPYERFENECKAFVPLRQQEIFFTEYKGEVLSTAIINFYGQTAFYNHGAAILKHPKVSSSHILLWETIKYSRIRGCRFYNFWGGIAPEENKKHHWWGITVFKRGFGGKQVNYIHAQDFHLSRGYYLTYLIETFNRKRRGL